MTTQYQLKENFVLYAKEPQKNNIENPPQAKF